MKREEIIKQEKTKKEKLRLIWLDATIETYKNILRAFNENSLHGHDFDWYFYISTELVKAKELKKK